MDINKLRIFDPDCLSISGRIILIGIELSRVYENGKYTDTIDGYKLKCIFPDNGYEKATIKVQTKPPINQEAIENSSNPIFCNFEEFEAKIYRDFKNNSFRLSCKAKSVLILK